MLLTDNHDVLLNDPVLLVMFLVALVVYLAIVATMNFVRWQWFDRRRTQCPSVMGNLQCAKHQGHEGSRHAAYSKKKRDTDSGTPTWHVTARWRRVSGDQ